MFRLARKLPLRLTVHRLAILGCGNFFFASPAFSAKSLRFVADTWPGIVEKSEGHRVCGIGALLAKTVSESLGYKFDLEKAPMIRGLKMLEANKVDAIIGVYKTPERERLLHYTTTPIYVDTMYAYILANRKIAWDGRVESLTSLRIGVMHGWYYTNRFKKMEKDDRSFKFQWIMELDNGFRMLSALHIDVLLTNERVFRDYVSRSKTETSSRQGLPEITALLPAMETQDIFIAFSPSSSKDLLSSFNRELTKLVSTLTVNHTALAATNCFSF